MAGTARGTRRLGKPVYEERQTPGEVRDREQPTSSAARLKRHTGYHIVPWRTCESLLRSLRRSTQTGALALLPLLIGADQDGLREDMIAHGRLDRRLIGVAQAREHRIERVELEDIAVAPNRRAGAAIARPPPIVDAGHRPRRQNLDALGKAARAPGAG